MPKYESLKINQLFVFHNMRGVTLIETLIYIFIFSLIVGGGIAAGFWTFETSARTGRLATIEAETDFVLRKINWASVGSTIVQPSSGASGSTLEFSRDGDVYLFALSGTTLTLSDGTTAVPLTTGNIAVSSFQATHTAAAGGVPASISVTMTLNGKTYGPKVYYVR